MQLLDKAILSYQEDGDHRGMSEALQSRSSAHKHLFQETQDKSFLILAKHDAIAGVEIAESIDDPSALPMVYRGLANTLEQTQDWEGALKYFTKAIEAFEKSPPAENNRPAVLSDMKAHLGYSTYKSGDKGKGLEILQTAIAELERDNVEVRYNKDVWLSEAHMRVAEMLRRDNTALATQHLQNAKKIIQSNPELELRSRQFEKLSTSFPTQQ